MSDVGVTSMTAELQRVAVRPPGPRPASIKAMLSSDPS